MMKKLMFAALAGASVFAVAPAQAVVITAGGAPTTPTLGQPANPGTLAQFGTFSGTAATFSATVRYAAYLNGLGQYDFYYQVQRTGAGSNPPASGNFDNAITSISVSSFAGFTTDVYAVTTDFDGAGGFTAAMNPDPAGFTTTANRPATNNGATVTFEFGANNLTGTETSATYVVRTNATNFSNFGTFGVIDGSTLTSMSFMPAAGVVPEPATWGMMLLGFGLIGAASRRSRRVTTVLA